MERIHARRQEAQRPSPWLRHLGGIVIRTLPKRPARRAWVACAALAATGLASAQSSVTLFGVVDAALSGYSNRSQDERPGAVNQGSVRMSQTALTNSGYNSSRLGFRGTEDLGGGMAAGFWLEGQLTNDDGNVGGLSFTRRSTVSLSGPWGEVRLGRDYAATFWNDTVYDPFGTVGAGATLLMAAQLYPLPTGTRTFGGNPNYVRTSNSVGYFLPPNLGGVYGELQYSLPENVGSSQPSSTPVAANSTRTGRYVGGRIGYASGPLDIAIAYGNSAIGDNHDAGTTDSVKTVNLGASYDFGVVKLLGEVSRLRTRRAYDAAPPVRTPDVDTTGFLLGLTAPIGAGLLRASWSQVDYDLNRVTPPGMAALPDPKARKLALGYVYNLSKRTALYATVAQVRNRNGAALVTGGPALVNNASFTPRTSTGYDLGIRHAF